MDSLLPILLSVVSAVLVYIINEWMRELLFEPRKEFKAMKGRIAYVLTKHSNMYHNPSKPSSLSPSGLEHGQTAENELREAAALLDAFIENLGMFKVGIPSKEKLQKVSRNLIGLSNGIFLPESDTQLDVLSFNIDCDKEIRNILKLRQK